jgi:hypothetical protein
MSDQDQLLQLLGISAPFAAASACYGLFAFLDMKASKDAKRVMARWMQGKESGAVKVNEVVLDGFDHLYGKPLLRVRSFLRSAFLSICAYLVYMLFEFKRVPAAYGWDGVLVFYILPLIVTDYLSLFLVRGCLSFSRSNLFFAILMALAGGAIIVLFGYTLSTILAIEWEWRPPLSQILPIVYHLYTSLQVDVMSGAVLFVPALFVYAWLPLLLLAKFASVGLRYFFRATDFVKWFLKRGEEHPFEAFGMIACTMVFVLGCSWQLFRYLQT